MPSDNYQGTSLARLVLLEDAKKTLLVQEDIPYGIGLGNSFTGAYKHRQSESMA